MTPIAVALLVVSLGATAVPAQSNVAQVPRGMLVSGELWFDGKATLGDFRGITRQARGEMSGGETLARVRGYVEADAASLTTNNGLRDGDMRKTLEVEKHKLIRFDLDSVSVKSESPDSAQIELVGRMTIHGVTRHIRIPSTMRRSAEQIRVTGTFDVVLPQYGVTNLKRFLGTLRMNELIHVGLDVTFRIAREGAESVLR